MHFLLQIFHMALKYGASQKIKYQMNLSNCNKKPLSQLHLREYQQNISGPLDGI